VDDQERRGTVLDALLARWAAIDPSAASAAVQPYRVRLRKFVRVPWQSLDSAVNAAWAKAEPDSALAEAIAAPDAPWVRATIWAALETLAEGDPMRQLDALSRLPVGRLRSEMCELAIKTLADKDSTAAEQKLDMLTEPRQRARVEAEILGKLTERDPAAGLARLAELAPELKPGTTGSRLLTKILLPAATKDPAAAIAALDGVPDELYQSAVGAVLVGWATDHPVEALEWAAANGVDIAEARAIQFYGEDGNGWTPLILTALNADRDKTMAWMLAQPASRERDAMLLEGGGSGTQQQLDLFNALTPDAQADAVWRVMNTFDGGTAAKAEAWVKDLPPGPIRSAGVENLVVLQYYNNPDRVDSLADAWPAGPERDGALSSLAHNVGYRDPQKGIDLARRVGDPISREIAFERITRIWLRRDEAAARAWLANSGEMPSEAKRVLLREFTNQ
jgi:hypothetical protein